MNGHFIAVNLIVLLMKVFFLDFNGSGKPQTSGNWIGNNLIGTIKISKFVRQESLGSSKILRMICLTFFEWKFQITLGGLIILEIKYSHFSTSILSPDG